jgi:hypothetical protein
MSQLFQSHLWRFVFVAQVKAHGRKKNNGPTPSKPSESLRLRQPLQGQLPDPKVAEPRIVGGTSPVVRDGCILRYDTRFRSIRL